MGNYRGTIPKEGINWWQKEGRFQENPQYPGRQAQAGSKWQLWQGQQPKQQLPGAQRPPWQLGPSRPSIGIGNTLMPRPPRMRGGYYGQLQLDPSANWRSMSWQPMLGMGLTRIAPPPQFEGEPVPGTNVAPQQEGQQAAPAWSPQEWFLGYDQTGQPVYAQSAQSGGYQRVYKPTPQPIWRGRRIGVPSFGGQTGYVSTVPGGAGVTYQDIAGMPQEVQQLRQQWAPHMSLTAWREHQRQNAYGQGQSAY